MAVLQGPERPASVLLAGGFGTGDLASDARLSAFLGALDGAEVTVISRTPRDTIRRHAVPAIGPTAMSQVLAAVRRSEAVIFGGGALLDGRLSGAGKPSLRRLRGATALASAARAAGTTVLGIGLGTGVPTSGTSRTLLREFARRTDMLVLRDADSARTAVAAGVPGPLRVGADPVWTTVGTWPRPAAVDDGSVAVVLDARATPAAVEDELGDVLTALLAQGLRVRIDPWQPGGDGPDLRLARRLADRAPGVQVAVPPDDIANGAARLAGARLVITARLHAQLAAAVAGVPCLALDIEDGQAALAGRLGQPVHEPTGTIEPLTAAVNAAMTAAPVSDAAVKAEVGAAQAGFDLMHLMLGGEIAHDTIDGLRLEPGR